MKSIGYIVLGVLATLCILAPIANAQGLASGGLKSGGTPVDGAAIAPASITSTGNIWSNGGDLQVNQGQALYMNGSTRTHGLIFDGTNIKFTGAASSPAPYGDQALNLGSASKQWAYLFLGGYVVNGASAVVGTDDGAGTNRAVTISVASGHVTLDCQDTNGCDVTLSETSALSGMSMCVVMIGTGTCNFADTAGVSETAGAFAAGQYDSICYRYISDRWVEMSRSNN